MYYIAFAENTMKVNIGAYITLAIKIGEATFSIRSVIMNELSYDVILETVSIQNMGLCSISNAITL